MSFQSDFISMMRMKFQSEEGRKGLLELMLREINYMQMGDKQQFVPFQEALNQLNDEIAKIDIVTIEEQIKKGFDNV